MAKVYVSSHDVDRAREVAVAIEASGQVVVSTWHIGDGPAMRSANLTDADKRDKARANCGQIAMADVLVVVAADDKVPGGKFVEAGFAIGRGKSVVVVGRRENILMHHPKVTQVDDVAAAVEACRATA